MRSGIAAAIAGCILAGVVLALTAPADRIAASKDYSGLLKQIDTMTPSPVQAPSADGFLLESAVWDDANRRLTVRATTNAESGMLLTLSGLPDSTWVDAFDISMDHAVQYALDIPYGQPVPCEVVVKSAAVSDVVSVINAPLACDNVLGIAGNVTGEGGLPMAGGLVSVTVGDTVFTTHTDARGDFTLEVYSDSPDAFVRITAEGAIGTRQTTLHVYEGSIGALQGADDLYASAWAREIFGRRMSRRMLASL